MGGKKYPSNFSNLFAKDIGFLFKCVKKLVRELMRECQRCIHCANKYMQIIFYSVSISIQKFYITQFVYFEEYVLSFYFAASND